MCSNLTTFVLGVFVTFQIVETLASYSHLSHELLLFLFYLINKLYRFFILNVSYYLSNFSLIKLLSCIIYLILSIQLFKMSFIIV